MKHSQVSALNRSRMRLALWLGLFAVSACGFDESDGSCGQSVTNNFRFDRWCGEELCNWTTVTGPESIRRVSTWHDNDYAVELLGTPTVITQKRFVRDIDCLAFELVADIDPSANVVIGLDYNIDGDPAEPADEADLSLDVALDDTITLPAASWKQLRFLFPMPVAYSGVRFVIKKTGEGRAVLAELRAVSSDDCTAARPVLTNLPVGIACDDPSTCASSNCTTTTPKQSLIDFCELVTPEQDCAAIWDAAEDLGDGPGVCSECGSNADCPGQVCGVADGDRGPFRRCMSVAVNGARCFDHDQCTSGHCVQLPTFNHTWLSIDTATCGECENDSDCDTGEICGLDPSLPARVCMEASTKPLSSRCEANAECTSGICCVGRCSECCELGTDSCSATCVTKMFERDGQRFETPRVCPERPAGPSGSECLDDADCVSGQCDGTEDVCTDEQSCIRNDCQQYASNTCDSLITVAGTCQ